MPWWGICLILFCAFIFYAFLHYIGKNKRPFRCALLSMLFGVLSLTAVNVSGCFTGVYLPVSLLSVLTSAIGGIPGVTLLLGLNLFF